EKLGSYFDKTQRILKLLPQIACAAGHAGPADDLLAAGRLAKCDLVTEMVKEFTDLQGIVGGLYARAEGYPETIWRAVYEQYQPLTTASPSPSTGAGAILSIADRIDTICGCFSIGLVPTGSKDPFALRRQGNGLLKIILDHRLPMSLGSLVRWGLDAGNVWSEEKAGALMQFFEGRLRFLLDEMAIAHDCINAAFAAGFDDPADTLERVRALQAIRHQEDFLALASAFKRINNILAQSAGTGGPPDELLLKEPAEAALYATASGILPQVAEARQSRDYLASLQALASLRPAVDRFFDQVLVMAEDPALRANRFRLLRQLADLFLGIADISQIVIAGRP
ncbi:MAG: glycine--tRNA ligase subunit beta, partial [Acidobacteria bacterium]|nr:glycine--tRNA ligase subunit beta [Acidobacteriota bacterium]